MSMRRGQRVGASILAVQQRSLKRRQWLRLERLEDRCLLTTVTGDFNGDGFDDLAIGAPGEDIGAIADAGAVNVIYGTPTGLSTEDNQLWEQDGAGILDLAEAGDRFGAALAAGDFDNDGFDDLAIGIPGENVGAIVDAGAVAVIYGSAAGLTSAGNQFWNQNSAGVLEISEPGDAFGTALATGDFDNDGFDDLAIGVPLENLGAAADAGAVNVLYGSAANLSPVGNQFWAQDSPGIADLSEPGDLFGFSLAVGDFDFNGSDDLAIGVPFENVGVVVDAGAVNVIYGAAAGLGPVGNDFWTQDVPGVLELAEPGDQFGYALAAGNFNGDLRDDLAVGIPAENLGAIVDAGAVAVFYGTAAAAGLSPAGNQFWNQNVGIVADVAEAGDLFGRSLAAGDFNNDGRDDLAIGVPFENIGAIADAGAVNVLYGGLVSLTDAFNQFWFQGGSVLGTLQAGDRFGSALVAGDFNGDGRADLAIGVPGEDIGAASNAGAVNVLYGSASRLTSKGDQFWHQDSADASGDILGVAQTDDEFGDELG